MDDDAQGAGLYARRLSERQTLVRRGARAAAGAGGTGDRQVREGTVRRGGAQEHVRAGGEGDGGEELTARPLMVRRRPCAVSNHEAPTVPLILRDAREERAP